MTVLLQKFGFSFTDQNRVNRFSWFHLEFRPLVSDLAHNFLDQFKVLDCAIFPLLLRHSFWPTGNDQVLFPLPLGVSDKLIAQAGVF